MLTRIQARGCIQGSGLPNDQVKEVYDYVAFLRRPNAETEVIDVSDIWSYDDINDLVRTSLECAERTG